MEPVKATNGRVVAVMILIFNEEQLSNRIMRDLARPVMDGQTGLYGGGGVRDRWFPDNEKKEEVLLEFSRRISQTEHELEEIIQLNGYSYIAWGTPLVELNKFTAIALSPLSDLEKSSLRRFHFFLLALLIGFLFSTVIGWQIAKRVISPVAIIQNGIKTVHEGDLSARMDINTQDEFGDLSETFNTMVAGLQEKERMSRYVSDFVREEVAREDQNEVALSRRVELTVLFADIRNFTALSEQYPAEEIVDMLNQYLSLMARVIREHNGVVDKFIGDAVMAVFHEQPQLQEHSERGVRCAMAMRKSLGEFNQTRRENKQFEVDNGVGIHTGDVILGSIGAKEERMDLTVIGDAVNVAARLESMSKHGKHSKVIISEETLRRVGDMVEVEEMAEKRVKGKSGEVAMFEVLVIR
jgi:adenylate cyclase